MKTRLVAIFFIVAQVILYAGAWRSVAPEETDFTAFYSAARIWQRGENPYDLQKQCVEGSQLRGGACLPFAHPPVLLPLVALLSNGDFEQSYHRWVLTLLGVVALCLIPLYQLSQSWKISFQSILFLPMFIGLALGQNTPFVFLSVLVWAWLLSNERDVLAGLALSLAVVKPQIAILLALPLLFVRIRAFAAFCVGGLVLTLFSFLLVGIEGFRGLSNIVGLMSRGQGFGINPEAMFNTTGLFARAGLGLGWVWALFALGLIAISLLWRKFGTSPHLLSVGMIIAVFCAPHLHAHDLSLLSIPILFVHPLAPAISSAILLTFYAFDSQHGAAYGVMLFLLLFHLRKIHFKTLPAAPKEICAAPSL